MKKYILFLLFVISYVEIFSQDSSQTFLSLRQTGVESFLKSYPKYDGRGTIIFILDTGVDMGIEGLQKTSTSETKVIDVKDFTGEGDVKLNEAETEKSGSDIMAEDKENHLSVKGLESLEYKPVDNKYLIGNLNEKRFTNSNAGVKDLNGNGKMDDNFVVIVFKSSGLGEEFWVAYIDLNVDGSLSDEQPIRDYKESPQPFYIKNPNRIPYLTFALNIFPDEKRVSIFFDDGGHGTHVAGIASGYRIGNQNLNGVAPGSKIIALKLGENTLSGGATISFSMRKAFLYADAVSKQRKEPCIVNMSYGIGSVIEGESDMELFLDSLLEKNPYLYVCISNGNDGPGISTTGLPAAAKYVFSSGAVLTKEVGRDNYGATINEDVILHFSSRGGEVPKPDICSPGAAVSTVANWSGGDKMWGTSMASPYTTGVMSLLLSAVTQKYPDVKIPSQLLFKAVRNSGVKFEGYNVLDQGGGLINVDNAFRLLEKYILNKEQNNFETYNISTFAPTMPDEKSEALYIRNGSYVKSEDNFRFTLSRSNPNKKETFYRIYNLKSDSDWLIPIQKKINIRNTQNAVVSVKFDTEKMKEPGLYAGTITGYRDDKSNFQEFSLVASVVIPYSFSRENNFTRTWNDEKLIPARHKRYFLEVPAGAGAMMINLTSVRKGNTYNQYRLFNPDGKLIYTSDILNTKSEEGIVESQHYDLCPGVYELVVHSYFLSPGETTYNLEVSFSGLKTADQETEMEFENQKIGLVNSFDVVKNYDMTGKLQGFQQKYKMEFKGETELEHSFVLRKNETSKIFEINLSNEDFNKVTDFSAMVFDDSGSAIEKISLNYPDDELKLSNTFLDDSVNLRFRLVPAFSNQADPITVNITEKTEVSSQEDFQVLFGGSTRASFYPGIEKNIECKVRKPDFKFPADTVPYGEVYLKSVKTKIIELIIPFTLKMQE